MQEKYLYQKMPFLLELREERRKRFVEYFATAPEELLESAQVIELETGTTLVRENEPVDRVYVIGRGTVKGIDFRIYGIEYDFIHFEGVYGLGAMEIIMGEDRYRTTLEAVTPCTVVKMPVAKFQAWIMTDIVALHRESRAIAKYLIDEVRNTRLNLFLKGTDRLAILFISFYEKLGAKGVQKITYTRTELSEVSGLCVKTINRSIKKFEDEGLVGRDGSKITINESQYERLKEIVEEITG